MATEHRTGMQQVSTLYRKAMKNRRFIEELLSREELQAMKRQQIQQVISQLNEFSGFLDSAHQVVE